MGKKLSPAQNELYQRTDEILHYIWDPIGVSDSPYARDEYWSYLPHVFGLLVEGASDAEIAECLVSVAADSIGLTPDHEKAKEVAKILKQGQPSVWVVPNRTMSRVNIPTHLITRELCEHLGYEHDVTLPREIPSKTLPWENAPENVPEPKGELMANENIVILQAPEEPEV
jgi:hypothetical protein